MHKFFSSIEKSAARIHVHKAASSLLGGQVRGGSVTLAGPDAGDVGCLKHILKARPEHTLFVDTDPRGLKKARGKWPGVRTFHGDVRSALDQVNDGLAFINLDFTGTLGEESLNAIRTAGNNLLPGGVLAYTFTRGRELPSGHARELIDKLGKGSDSDDRRAVAYSRAIGRVSGGSLRPSFLVRYDSNACRGGMRHAPMGVLVFQKEGRTTLPSVRISSRTVEESIRNEILSMTHAGLSSDEIAQILSLHKGTISAVLANATRGTYRRK